MVNKTGNTIQLPVETEDLIIHEWHTCTKIICLLCRDKEDKNVLVAIEFSDDFCPLSLTGAAIESAVDMSGTNHVSLYDVQQLETFHCPLK